MKGSIDEWIVCHVVTIYILNNFNWNNSQTKIVSFFKWRWCTLGIYGEKNNMAQMNKYDYHMKWAMQMNFSFLDFRFFEIMGISYIWIVHFLLWRHFPHMWCSLVFLLLFAEFIYLFISVCFSLFCLCLLAVVYHYNVFFSSLICDVHRLLWTLTCMIMSNLDK